MLCKSIVCWSLNLLVAASAAGQQQPQPGLPKPGPEHARLKELEGDWNTVTIMTDGKKTKGEATYKMTCGGLWLSSDFKGELEGAPFQGRGLDSYDPAKKKYVAVWVDSMLTAPLLMEGTHDELSKTTTMNGEFTGPDGKPARLRGVTRLPDKDHMTFEMYMVGPDGKDTKMMTIEYTRRRP